MAQAFYPNVGELANDALTQIGAMDPEGGVTPTTSMRNAAMQLANYMILAWQAHGMQVWCLKAASHALTTSTNNYSAGPSADINIARPLAIVEARLRDTVAAPDVDIPLRIISEEEYHRISVKDSTGTPNCLFYDPQYDLPASNAGANATGRIFLWPTPDAATVTQYDLYFTYQRPIQDFSALTDELDFPQEWYDALLWNLSYRLTFSYEVPKPKQNELEKLARESLNLALSWDVDKTPVTIGPASA